MKVSLLIRAYQFNGYLGANIDPLNLETLEEKKKKFRIFSQVSSLDYKNYGFTENDLDREILINTSELISGIFSEKKPLKLKDIISRLKKSYCNTIGIEYMYLSSIEECNFIREKIENDWCNYESTKEEKIELFDRLSWAVLFEEICRSKFTTKNRFGLEGLETLVTGLKAFVDKAVDLGLKDITLGMAHRGRLNVLANVFRKPISTIFAEFQNKHISLENEQIGESSGDVKYHLGTHYLRTYEDGKTINMEILPNPSHLECVNPVVMGKTRAKQHFSNDFLRQENMSILVHGDAAITGQGVLYESMQMSNLESFTTGGILHVVANNQIGFTTSPYDGRSTPFCTDIGKTLEAPIIHVNADDPIAVDFAFRTAAEFLKKFKRDVIIDVIGYRRYGHNELDQPLFTQPLMYEKIKSIENVLKIYQERLINENISTKDELENFKLKIKQILENYYKDASNNKFDFCDWVPTQWQNFKVIKYSTPQNTGVSIKRLRSLGEKITSFPLNFYPNPQVKRIYQARADSINSGVGIDWATAESLAWAELLDSGYTVRLTGEDSERGAFSHRHAVLHDQKNDFKYIPLENIAVQKNNFQIHNSLLSEYAVLGFELGFSYQSPDALVIWEAQFGDFVNGAQVIVDQFLTCGELKWNVSSGIVLLLPHGMDGEGPDHSSCKIERFLSLMDDDPTKIPDLKSDTNLQIIKTNMQVCNPTTPANYFHVLLRQIKRQFRKPLIIPSPKKLLRYKPTFSELAEFDEGLKFIKVKPDKTHINSNKKKVKKILFCSGQVYYDLLHRREKLERNVN